MSELPNQVPAVPVGMRPCPVEEPERPSRRESPLMNRVMFIFVFLLFIGVTVAFTPQIAKQIAYSWNIGVERARADVARQFLDDNSFSVSDQRTAWVAHAVAPGIVGVHTLVSKPPEEFNVMPDWRGDSEALGFDIGSGIIIDDQGFILTNYHVIAGALEIRVQLSDGRVIEAELIGQDRAIDLAVLRIDARDLRAIDWGDSRRVTVGERVLAIGSPFGLQQTVTSGIISAVERYDALRIIGGPRRGVGSFPHEFIQTDAPINPGNSGGALVDMNGKVVGICTWIYTSEQGGNSGVGFAIPSSTAKRIYDEIVSLGVVRRGWIGVRTDDLIWYDARQMGQDKPKGAIITSFFPRSPASDAGLQRGDIIRQWGETEITSPLHLIHLVTLTKPGTVVPVEVFRKGEILMFDVTVGSRQTDL